MSYPGHRWGRGYSSAEMQSVYSTAPANWAIYLWISSMQMMLIVAESQKWLQSLDAMFFVEDMLVYRWEKCIKLNNDYIVVYA